MKKILIFGFIAIVILITVSLSKKSGDVQIDRENEFFTVGITQIVAHPALDAIKDSIISRLAERGFVEGQNLEIIFRNANGDPGLTLPIAENFVSKQVDVIVPITTPSALSVAKVAGNIPVIFSAVSYPVDVGLVTNLEMPGGTISGTSDQWPFAEQIKTYLEIVPSTKTIGMIYKPGDDVGKKGLDAVKTMADTGQFELVARPISQSSDIYTTAVDLFRSVDVIYTGIDLLVAENFSAILKASRETGKPILGGDSGSVEQGAIMALSVGMEEIGAQTGDMVADVLEGANPGDMPVQTISEGSLFVNREVAEQFELDIEYILGNYTDVTIFEVE